MRATNPGRQAILQAARRAFIANAGDIEVKEVAQAAGVSVGLIYHHFRSKAGLLSALINEFYDRYDAVINQRFDKSLPWAERERGRLYDTVKHLLDDPMAPIVLGPLSASAEVSAVEARRREAIISLAAHNILRAQERGEIDPALDPEAAAAMINGGLRQAVALMFAGRLPRDAEAFTEMAWRIIAQGLSLRCAE